jgi:hypothetical protein
MAGKYRRPINRAKRRNLLAKKRKPATLLTTNEEMEKSQGIHGIHPTYPPSITNGSWITNGKRLAMTKVPPLWLAQSML